MCNVNVVNRITCFCLIVFSWRLLLWPSWPPPGYAPDVSSSSGDSVPKSNSQLSVLPVLRVRYKYAAISSVADLSQFYHTKCELPAITENKLHALQTSNQPLIQVKAVTVRDIYMHLQTAEQDSLGNNYFFAGSSTTTSTSTAGAASRRGGRQYGHGPLQSVSGTWSSVGKGFSMS